MVITRKRKQQLIEGKMFIQVDSASKYIEEIKKDIIADSLGFENDSIYKVFLDVIRGLIQVNYL